MRVLTVDELHAAKGTRVGTGEWTTVDQPQIDLFADATHDHHWIHVDPDQAKDGPFGATIAHGLLTLSLLPSSSTRSTLSRARRWASTTASTVCASPPPCRPAAGYGRQWTCSTSPTSRVACS
jgi:acyl dehydratase